MNLWRNYLCKTFFNGKIYLYSRMNKNIFGKNYKHIRFFDEVYIL